MYTQQGQNAVRNLLLQFGYDPIVIDFIIALLSTSETDSTVLSSETVSLLCQSVLHIKRDAEQQELDWAKKLVFLQDDFAAQGIHRVDEVLWMDALLAILRDKPVNLDSNNLYYEATQTLLRQLGFIPESEPDLVTLSPVLEEDFIENMTQITIAVMTDMPQELEVHSQYIYEMLVDYKWVAPQYQAEAEWMDTLLTILNRESVTLSEDNPYYNATQCIISAIETYRQKQRSSA